MSEEIILYTKDHEWIKKTGDQSYMVGITEHAQDALGELVFVDFPAINAEFSKGDAFIVVESVKAASDVYSPISGTVIEINDALNSNPSMVNSDPQGDGWLCIIQSENADMSGLMNEAEYQSLLETLDH